MTPLITIIIKCHNRQLINLRGLQVKKVLVFLFISIVSFSSQAALIHQYDFEGGVIDLVGSEDGTFFNGASINAGVLTLDGVDDYVEFASHVHIVHIGHPTVGIILQYTK
jgi:hypothetical protein